MLELTQARTRARSRNGKFKHSSLHSWRNRKKSFEDYFPYVLAVISIWSVVILKDFAPIAQAFYEMTGKVEIVNRESSLARSHQESTEVDEGHGEPVSADSFNDGASDEVVIAHSEPRPTLSDDSVIEKIKLAFIGTGDEDKMVKVLQCESRFNPNTVGDLGIQFEKDGKLWGRSVGIAQIRILPGRTDDPYKYDRQLRDVDFNLKEARAIYDRQGIGAWLNCAKIVGAI